MLWPIELTARCASPARYSGYGGGRAAATFKPPERDWTVQRPQRRRFGCHLIFAASRAAVNVPKRRTAAPYRAAFSRRTDESARCLPWRLADLMAATTC